MDKMDIKFIAHVATEIIVLCAVTFYFYKKNASLEQRLKELEMSVGQLYQIFESNMRSIGMGPPPQSQPQPNPQSQIGTQPNPQPRAQPPRPQRPNPPPPSQSQQHPPPQSHPPQQSQISAVPHDSPMRVEPVDDAADYTQEELDKVLNEELQDCEGDYCDVLE